MTSPTLITTQQAPSSPNEARPKTDQSSERLPKTEEPPATVKAILREMATGIERAYGPRPENADHNHMCGDCPDCGNGLL